MKRIFRLAVLAQVLVVGAEAETIPAPQVTFRDVTAQSGFLKRNASWGVAWADYDGDGNIDAFTVGHVHSICQLWRNNGNGTFSDVTTQAGLIKEDGDAHGCAWGDFDGDGLVDLYVSKGTVTDLTVNYNDLWKNNGDGTFTNIATTVGAAGLGSCDQLKCGRFRSNIATAIFKKDDRGCGAIDYDRDAQLDIFVTGTFQTGALCRDGNQLYHNDASGSQFTDKGTESGLLRELADNRTAAWGDFDGDGWMDVLIAHPSVLYKNLGDGTFLDVTAAAGIISSDNTQSAAWGDYDNDGDLDLYVTMGVEDGPPVQGILYQNNGDGTFGDVTTQSGAVNVAGALGVTWGDYDNDGKLDLYVVNTEPGTTQPNRLFRNNGNGTFTDVAVRAGVGGKKGGQGSDATFIDYDNDGCLDLFVCNGGGSALGPYLLYRNNGTRNGWLKVTLSGTQSNRGGLGAKLFLTAGGQTQFREYTGQHYMAQNYLPIHFGLGRATIVDSLIIQWPSGTAQELDHITINQVLPVVEP